MNSLLATGQKLESPEEFHVQQTDRKCCFITTSALSSSLNFSKCQHEFV